MSEPMWMQGDTLTLRSTTYSTQEVECDCGNSQEIDVEQEYSHNTTTWWGEWTCTNCNDHHESEGWY